MHAQERVALGGGEEVDEEDAKGDADVQAAAAEAEAAAAEEERQLLLHGLRERQLQGVVYYDVPVTRVHKRVALGDGEEVDEEDAVGNADVQAAVARLTHITLLTETQAYLQEALMCLALAQMRVALGDGEEVDEEDAMGTRTCRRPRRRPRPPPLRKRSRSLCMSSSEKGNRSGVFTGCVCHACADARGPG